MEFANAAAFMRTQRKKRKTNAMMGPYAYFLPVGGCLGMS
jgi:hypothetical protein